MDSSSDDEGVFVYRKSNARKIHDSDDEDKETKIPSDLDPTEELNLHLSDDDDQCETIQAKIEASLDEPQEDANSSALVFSNPQNFSFASKAQNTLEEAASSTNSSKVESTGSNLKSNFEGRAERGTEDILKKLAALAGSDSESDEDIYLHQENTNNARGNNVIEDSGGGNSDIVRDLPTGNSRPQLENKKRKSIPERKSKTKAKDAMLEIKAESQRQLRQSKLGLPYHVPKQRSLFDFLNRRKSSSPMPIKGPVEHLASVWKQIEDREKDVEEFYKSESENDSDADDSVCSKTTEHDEDNEKNCESVKRKPDLMQSNTTEVTEDPKIKNLESEVHSLPIDTDQIVDCKTISTIQQEIDSGILVENKTESVHVVSSEDKASIVEESQLVKVKSVESHIEITQQSDNILEDNISQLPITELIVQTQDSQDISVHLSEIRNDAESVECIEHNMSNVKHVKEFNVQDDQQPNRVSGVMCKITKSQTQDSQDMSLYLSETENYPGVSETGTYLPEEEAVGRKESSDKEEMAGGQKMTWKDLDSAIRFNNDNNVDTEDETDVNAEAQKSLLIPGPRLILKGGPNDVIDLDGSNNSYKPGVKGLIERFMKHSSSKRKTCGAHAVEMSVISSEKDTLGMVVDVKQESVKIILSGDDDCLPERNPIPGVRLKLLKNELNQQMRKQKEEEWQKRLEEMRNEKCFDGEKDECGGDLPGEGDSDEETTDTEGESEPEINDVREPKEKKRFKSMFLDEEAEVEDESGEKYADLDDDAGSDREDDEEEDDDDSDQFVEENDSDKEDGEGSDVGCEDIKNKKKVSTPLMSKPLHDSTCGKHKVEDNQATGSLRRVMTSASDLFFSPSNEWQNPADDDDFIPAGQPNGVVQEDHFTQKSDESKDRPLFLSPCLSISENCPSFMDTQHDLTPLKCSWSNEYKSPNGIKQLFSETEAVSTQEKFAELTGLFAEKFKDSQEMQNALTNTSTNAESDTDLMALCSGKFVSQLPEPKDLEEGCTQTFPTSNSQFQSQGSKIEESFDYSLVTENSVDFSLKWDGDPKTSEHVDCGSTKHKEKFNLEIVSSDEEEDPVSPQKQKKKSRRLEFSDDEESDGKDSDDSFGSGLSDAEDQGNEPEKETCKLFGVFNKTSKEVFYDSDENEIEPGAFLEKEAELSEEEDWNGSEDEDEKGLDQLEMDEADKEDIDQDVVREQLVKSHMQKMLDEDRRDVRILQEMLLEDGELHSEAGGRERQFRWKNVDSSGMGDTTPLSDDEHANQDDEEDDAEWRKQRHEREMFLREQQEKLEKEGDKLGDDEVLENSELLQLGKSVLFKSRSSSMELVPSKDVQISKLTDNNKSPDGKRTNTFFMKRGSFLSRGDNVLAKLAKITGSAKENVLAGAKNSGNFVFSSISSSSEKDCHPKEEFDSKLSKRKANDFLTHLEKKQCMDPSKKRKSGLFDHL